MEPTDLEDVLAKLHDNGCPRCRARAKSDRLDRGPVTVRVGNKPGLRSATDRWGQRVPFWFAEQYGLVTERRWQAIEEFQAPVDHAKMYAAARECKSVEDAMKTPAGQELARKLAQNPANSSVWEINVEHARTRGEWLRMVVFFGEPSLVRWTWFDARVKLPVLQLVAWVLTKLRVAR
jgi:hypothetical protein